MDYQTLFNLVMGVLGPLAMWQFVNLHKKIDRLTEEDRDLMMKVGALQVLVAGQYVTRTEFDAKVDAFFAKLDSIDDKLDRRSRT